MSLVSKFKSYFALDDEYEYKEKIIEEEIPEPKMKSKQTHTNTPKTE